MDDKSSSNKKYFDVSPPSTAPTVKPLNRQMMKKTEDAPKVDKTFSEDSNDPTKPSNGTDNSGDSSKIVDSAQESHPDFANMAKNATKAAEEAKKSEIADKKAEKPDTEAAAEAEAEKEKQKELENLPQVNPLPETESDSDPDPKTEEDADQLKDDETVKAEEESSEPDSDFDKDTDKKEEKADKAKDNLPVNVKSTEDVPASSDDKFATSDGLPDASQAAAKEAAENMQDPKIYDTKEYYVPIGVTHHKHGTAKAAIMFGILFAIIVVGGILYFMVKLGK